MKIIKMPMPAIPKFLTNLGQKMKLENALKLRTSPRKVITSLNGSIPMTKPPVARTQFPKIKQPSKLDLIRASPIAGIVRNGLAAMALFGTTVTTKILSYIPIIGQPLAEFTGAVGNRLLQEGKKIELPRRVEFEPPNPPEEATKPPEKVKEPSYIS